jgi:phosphate transport system protein
MASSPAPQFQAEIGHLRGLILEMGGLAEVAITEAIQALVLHDDDQAQLVVAGVDKLDALEAEVDRLAARIIAARNPVTDELCDVIAALKISGILERIGDYAQNITTRVGHIEDRPKSGPLTLIPTMAEIAKSMVRDVLKAYNARDAALAIEVINRDYKVDNFYDSIFRNLVAHMMESPSTINSAAQLLFVARNLEQIGDNATNIAEIVYFAATGVYYSDHDIPCGLEKVI